MKPSTSTDEITVYYYVRQFFPEAKNRFRFSSENNQLFEADIYIPTIRVAIEYDGFFWHKDKYSRDIEKNQFFANSGIYVIHIRETGLRPLPEFLGRELWHKVGKTGKGLHTNEYISLVLNDLAQFCDYEKAKALNEFSLSYEQYKLDLPTINSLIYDSPVPNSVAGKPVLHYWDHEKNGPLNPENIPIGTDIRVYLKCPAHKSLYVNVSIASQEQQYYPSSDLCKYICILYGRFDICRDRCMQYDEQAKRCVDSIAYLKANLKMTDYLWMQRNAFNNDEIIRYIFLARLKNTLSRDSFQMCFLESNAFLHYSPIVDITTSETLLYARMVQEKDGYFKIRFDAGRFDINDESRKTLFDYLDYALSNTNKEMRGTYLNELFCICVQQKRFVTASMKKALQKTMKKHSVITISPTIDQLIRE